MKPLHSKGFFYFLWFNFFNFMFMPVIEDFNVSSKTRYVLWEITENYETLFSGIELDLNSKQLLSQKKLETHKNQFLAVRYLLKYLSSLISFI